MFNRSGLLLRVAPTVLAAAGLATAVSADPIPLNPTVATTPTVWPMTTAQAEGFAAWQLAGGWLDQAPVSMSGSGTRTSGGFGFRGGPGSNPGSSTIIRWPSLPPSGPIVLGPITMPMPTSEPEIPGVDAGPFDQPTTYAPIPSTFGGFGDPGFTPPPVVPLPAAAWAGLAAMPLVAGAGWSRRRSHQR